MHPIQARNRLHGTEKLIIVHLFAFFQKGLRSLAIWRLPKSGILTPSQHKRRKAMRELVSIAPIEDELGDVRTTLKKERFSRLEF